MPTLFDLCTNPESKKKLDELNQHLKAEREAELKAESEERERRHREKHIFDSYEQALDWLTQNPDSVISWHVKTLSWQPNENKFLSFEQEYSLDGVVPYNVKRLYTREELLDQIHTYLKKRGMVLEELKDKYGKLDYVHIIKK